MNPARTRLVLAFALGLAAFLLYWPSLGSGFVYDAESQIQHDSYIHTPAHLVDVVTLHVFAQDVLDGTRPVHLFFLMTDSLLWGRQAFGYHLTSNLLHAVNAGLLFLLLARLGRQVAPDQSPKRILLASAIGTLLFVVHPVIVEAISEVSDREDPLAAFFLLAALSFSACFPSRRLRRSILIGAVCILLLVLAAGSKETGFVGPLLLALYASMFRPGTPRKPWIILIAVAFLAVGILAFARFDLQPAASKIFTEKPTYLGGSLGATLSIQPRIWAFLLANTAWPLHLSADYTPQNVAWITLPAAIAGLAVFLSVQFLLSSKSRLALFGTVVFWLGLAPVSNFIPLYRPIGDRFLYLPMVGLAALVCAALLLLRGRVVFRVVCGITIAMELALAPLMWRRQAVFANSLNLWRDTAEKSPFSLTAADNLGYALSNTGHYHEALSAFSRAIGISKGFPDAWAGAAITLDRMGRAADADAALEKAVALDPRYARPRDLVESMIQDEATAAAIQKIADRLPEPRPSP